MKRFILSLLTLVLLTSLALNQGTGQKTDGQTQGTMPHGNMKGFMHEMGGHKMDGGIMYSMMGHKVIMKTNALDLTETQKKEISELNDKYPYRMVQKEADFRVAHMKMMNMMQGPNFDPQALKSGIKTYNDLTCRWPT